MKSMPPLQPAPTTNSSSELATTTLEEQVEALLAQMTLAEKIGQMTLVEKNSLTPDDVRTRFLGGVLSGGGGVPTKNTPEAWVEMTTSFQEAALSTRMGIPILYGSDAVHGHSNLKGATIFPHNIGLGASGNEALVAEIGRITAVETAATGVNWNYAPMVGVALDVRWGRTYESFSEDTALVTKLGTAYLEGLQRERLTIIGTPKHFIADGGTLFGTANTTILDKEYLIDRGDAQINEAALRAVHLPPYEAAIDAGARSIMVSYSSWNGVKNHANAALLTDLLKGELGFDGFVVSDWEALSEIAPNNYDAVVSGINAGLDMIMVPYNFDLFIRSTTSAVENGDIEMSRIDDAVRRILRVKMEMGLFENSYPDESLLSQIGSAEHRAVARQAVQESAVLLTHQNDVLPIDKAAPLLFVAGEAGDDIGLQSGGWTIDWQGKSGNITPGTTILDGIKDAVSETTRVQYNRWGRFDRINDQNGDPLIADVGIVVLAEQPYAEGIGDSADLTLDNLELIERVAERSHQTIVIVLSGRPVIIAEHIHSADAWIAAWLIGTEGQGIADLLFGDVPFIGKLPFSWPRTVSQLPFDYANLPTEGCDAPLFHFAHGLSTSESFVPEQGC